MLTALPSSAATLSDAVFIDLLDPTDEERARVEQATNLRLPTNAEIREIESSSRVYAEGGAFYLSTPVLETSDCMNGKVTSIGFVLAPARLVTLRFGPVASFDAVMASYAKVTTPAPIDAFLRILEAIVDATADALEHASGELESISHSAFRADHPRRRKASDALRAALRRLGRMGDGISHIGGTLLGLDRIAAFVHENARETLSSADTKRSNAIRTDITSLNEYEEHLSSKVQFLLDATLGFISIEQNEIVKMLTVVSVAGVPPVLVAGIYGMNFKNIPEFSWALGYPYALVLILVSAVVPVVWLKWRGWM